ncbi:DUF523 domain-containing protein [Raoultibacter phocaeensis]|uniref:DUF523 domain-containing protein n=1 Tax=Raoultibacter phocaeensis TaxID=2479841 RepID=UPI0021055499|nr:DUF523 domain-containing protein [Raoultibacter phocaeensis]
MDGAALTASAQSGESGAFSGSMARPAVLVSACLLGEPCRYDGRACACEGIGALSAAVEIVAVCPEVAGGLPIPREPAELSRGRATTRSGVDVTEAYRRGAAEAVRLACERGCRFAVLKERSPSCGYGEVYDGTFAGILVEGDGIAAAQLAKAGIEVFGESRIDELITLVKR